MINVSSCLRRSNWLKVGVLSLVVSLAVVSLPDRAEANPNSFPVSCSLTNVALFPVRCGGEQELVEVTHQFALGFLSAGGPREVLPHIIHRVMPCESSYNRYAVNKVGPFYGLMQFLPATWHALDGGNWYSARVQGENTAKLLADSDPSTQWPVCWFA